MRNPFTDWGGGPAVEYIDWPRKMAEAEVKLAMAVGFLKTIPTEEDDFEEAEAWMGRLDRFLQQFDGSPDALAD